MKRRLLSLLTATAIAIAVPLAAQEEGPAGQAKGASVDTTGKGYTGAFVIDKNSKKVLFAENADVSLPTASMAKMMTLLIAMERIRDGELKLNDQVTISARASKMGGSQIYAKDGQVFSVQTLLAATMIQSANDAAQALAEKMAGSSESFADMMNDRAKELGLTKSMFYDPHGLPNPKNPKQINMMSPRDLAVLGAEVMKYPLMAQYAKTPTMPFSNGTFTSGLTNPNHLVNPGRPAYWDAATGIKTGYSGPAGFSVTASAKRGDMELICVVMGAATSRGELSSFNIARRLMNNAFNQFRTVHVVKKGAVVGTVKVEDGTVETVQAISAGDGKALVQRGQEKGTTFKFVPTNLTAPVRKGQQIGTILVMQGNQQLSKIPAIAAADVAEEPWWKIFWPF